MPRQTKHPIVYLALSPAALAGALGLEPRVIHEAILLGHLTPRQIGSKRRIWVGDAEQWFRKHWHVKTKKPPTKRSEQS